MIPIASRRRNDFSVKPRKLRLQTFWKFNPLLEINRRIFQKKKNPTSPHGFRKSWIQRRKYCCFLEEHKPREGESRKSWTHHVSGRSLFRKPYSVCTHRRNALISVGKGEELKYKHRKKVSFGMGHNMRAENSVFDLNFWAVLPRYKYLNREHFFREFFTKDHFSRDLLSWEFFSRGPFFWEPFCRGPFISGLFIRGLFFHVSGPFFRRLSDFFQGTFFREPFLQGPFFLGTSFPRTIPYNVPTEVFADRYFGFPAVY